MPTLASRDDIFHRAVGNAVAFAAVVLAILQRSFIQIQGLTVGGVRD